MNEKELIKKGEADKVEFKESLGLTDGIGETVSAFSNTLGGIILIGIADFGKIIGVDIGKKTIEKLANHIKQNTDNHIYPKITIGNIKDKRIIVVHVNEANEKPVFFKGHAFKRIGKSNHKLSASEIRQLAKESGQKIYWDEQPCKDSSLDDIDKEKVKKYLELREKHRNISKKVRISFDRFLENIKAVKGNNTTNAGILFFGKNPSNAQLRLSRIKGKEIYGPILDRKDCEGTLWAMVDQAEMFFKEHINRIKSEISAL